MTRRIKDSGRSGLDFEAVLDEAHEAYRSVGLACIQRLPVPTVQAGRHHIGPTFGAVIRHSHGRLRVLSKKQGFDYIGCFGLSAGPGERPWALAGRMIAVESKATTRETKSLPIIAAGSTGSGLAEHQLRGLVECYEKFGAVSVVIFRCPAGDMLITPDRLVSALQGFEAGGRRSIPVSAMLPVETVMWPGFGRIVDYLYTLRQWLYQTPQPVITGRPNMQQNLFRINESDRTVVVGSRDGQETPPRVIEWPMFANFRMVHEICLQADDADDIERALRAMQPACEGQG